MARTDSERLAKLKEIRDDAEDRLAELLQNHKASYNIDGQEIDWNTYYAKLQAIIKDTTAEIERLDGGAFEFHTTAFT